MDVEVLRWPNDEARAGDLRARGIPRLFVVDGAPPELADCLEDWVSSSATDAEREARRAAIARRAEQHGALPWVDDNGLLHHRDGWVALSPVEVSLAGALVERYGNVVGRDALADRVWPNGAQTRNALDVHVLRLRRRIATLKLEIRTVRARGYLLQAVSGNGARS
ncbi:MAG: helix-turn-helix domain-containing protein [Actinomycetota bacterium]